MNHKRHPLDIQWFNGSTTSWATASGEEVSRYMMGAGRRNDLSWLVIPKKDGDSSAWTKKNNVWTYWNIWSWYAMVVLPELEVEGKLDVYSILHDYFWQENSPLGWRYNCSKIWWK